MILVEAEKTYLVKTYDGLQDAYVIRIEIAENGEGFINYEIEDKVSWVELQTFKDFVKLELKYD